MPKAGCIGTEMNKALTLFELRHSPGCNVTLLDCLTTIVLWMWPGKVPTRGLSILVSTL